MLSAVLWVCKNVKDEENLFALAWDLANGLTRPICSLLHWAGQTLGSTTPPSWLDPPNVASARCLLHKLVVVLRIVRSKVTDEETMTAHHCFRSRLLYQPKCNFTCVYSEAEKKLLCEWIWITLPCESDGNLMWCKQPARSSHLKYRSIESSCIDCRPMEDISFVYSTSHDKRWW